MLTRPTRSLIVRRWVIATCTVAIVAATAWATSDRWWPMALRNTDPAGEAKEETGHQHEGGHAHDHSGHVEESSIKLSENGLKNIGYRPVTVTLSTFEKTVTMPAIVVEQPGRSRIDLATPLTGILTDIYVVAGEAVEQNSPMFQVRLTHEEIVTAQRDYLLTSESLNVVDREIARLQSVPEGAVPGKRILEQQYEKQKLEASLLAGQQALVLHGLNEAQIAEIRNSKKLLQTLTIRAPIHTDTDKDCGVHLFHVQKLAVSRGQQVTAGQELCVLADHCELFVEGLAYEDDAKRLRDAAREGWDITGTHMADESQSEKIEGLKLLYVSDQIDPESRNFHFYLRLPNKVALDQKSSTGHRFIEWEFKPGQRMELRVPVERMSDRIVLPVDAVIDEGAEAYVYRRNGDHFDRVPVNLEYRDRETAVVANNGSLFPGDVVAGRGAYQIHLALKNKAGGGVDPHAGHQH